MKNDIFSTSPTTREKHGHKWKEDHNVMNIASYCFPLFREVMADDSRKPVSG